MKITILPALTAACALTFAGPAYAQRGHGPQPRAPKGPTTHVQSGAATHGGAHGGGAATHGGGASVHGSGAATHGGTHATSPKSTTHGSGAAATKTKSATKTSTATTSTTASGTTTSAGATTTSSTELSPLQQKLLKNTNLAAKLQTRLPQGVLVQDACVGFKNLGQFVAAVNVSNNLGIDFAQLKAKMTGTTVSGEKIAGATTTMSLGQAIHTLKPTVDADGEALTAQRQADSMIAGSSR